ncbi:hypothetical protein HO133_005685 [Letharia lupina]|uniref:Uncharacterized protein n=1 Tax=Letharia lupina TaxID=560253 RepID=A0A8H6C7F1_9LECA|nr:uncharacterized protein HO133_005685 [Letharia lupina]KAF6218338.1 hypothetical protein HO133_005685 [Letharia lupina]
MNDGKKSRRRRSSSLIYQEPPESIEHMSDQSALPNVNADWVNAKGAWAIHVICIIGLKLLFDVIPGVSQETSWTLVNIVYMFSSYLMFHYVRGVPFEFNAGAYDNLNMWEQIDNGDQYTPAKKFLLSVPIVLFLLSTHYTHYDLTYFIINFLAVLGVVIPKLPSSHRMRVNLMLECRQGTDLYILCGSKEMAVYRAIVWSQSPRLKDLSIVEMSQYRFSNYSHFEESGEFGVSGGPGARLHVVVSTLAKKYKLPALALLARKHFIEAVKEHRDTNFPLFAGDGLAAIYAKPMPKPDLTPEGGRKGPWDLEPAESSFINKLCYLQIELRAEIWVKNLYTTLFDYGAVGEPETAKALGRTSDGSLGQFELGSGGHLPDALEVFKEKFKDSTGLDWANTFDQPGASKYTDIEIRLYSVLDGWNNPVSKPLQIKANHHKMMYPQPTSPTLSDVSKPRTSSRLHSDHLPDRAETTGSSFAGAPEPLFPTCPSASTGIPAPPTE